MMKWGPHEGDVDGNPGKPPPKWPTIADYHPDHQPSSGAVFIEALGERVVGILTVKGLGVLVFGASPADYTDEAGRLKFDGTLAIFTKEEIGYSPNI